MLQVTINLYSFSELEGAAREKAILEHGQFLDSFPIDYENEQGEMVNEYVEYTEAEIIENIEANEYTYYKDGSIARLISYCGAHEKSGKVELSLFGETYSL